MSISACSASTESKYTIIYEVQNLIDKIKNDKAIQQVLYYIVLGLIFLLENVIIKGKFNMHSKMDDIIPFVPIFVIPYFMWYIFIVLEEVYFLLKSKEDLRKTTLSINLCMITAMIIYILFPNYQSLRPVAYESDFFSQWVRLLQMSDSSSSVCPSLHVAVAISLYLGVINSSCFIKQPGIKLATLILTFLICISTVLIKQHSVIDVAAGMLLSISVYIYVYKIKENEQALLYYEEADNADNIQ